MASKTVYLVSAIHPNEVKALIEKQLPEVTVQIVQIEGLKGIEQKNVVSAIVDLTPGDIEVLGNAEILILDNNLLQSVAYTLPKLRWAQCSFAGVNIPIANMAADLAKGKYPPFVATRFTGDSYGQLIFEFCLCFMIGNERGFIEHIKLQPSKGLG
ncbi:hypothetical protein HDE_05799 [Halotydeus destructor]|nr:hypothetical protein HDE_05799 [Halotydeus destructor]